MAGILVCVVGPSGAGKDTLIAGARKALEEDDHFVFPRRIVTREASEAEDHDTLPPERFAALKKQGRFALSWDAHGLSYAIPGLVLDDLAGRRIAICNLSRRALGDARSRFPETRVVLVTAPRDTLRSRILARGREDGGAVDRRLDREAAMTNLPVDCTISNIGAVDTHVGEFVAFLRGLTADRTPEPFALGRFAS